MLFEYADYARRIADLRERAERSAEKAGTGLTLRESAEGKFRLVFAGQFSAGKSTIIKALTGIKGYYSRPSIGMANRAGFFKPAA